MKLKKTECEIRVCKNKKCQRPLPEGYKHKYCEACRTEFAEKLKTGGKAVLSVAGTAACVVIAVATGGRFNPKD